MAKVPFIFAKFDVNYADHPKIARLSDAAFRAHVEMVLYARKYLTDGRIPNRFANRFGSETLTELETNDIPSDDPTGNPSPSIAKLNDGDYMIYGFLDMQDSRESAEARSQVNTVNGRLGGRPKKTHSVTKSQTESGSEKKPESESESESESELKRSTKKTRRRRSSQALTENEGDAMFDDFWDAYPRPAGKLQAIKNWDRITKKVDPAEIVAAARRYRDDPNRNQDLTYIPEAPKWLNDGRWVDPPCPPRLDKKRPGEKLQDLIAAMETEPKSSYEIVDGYVTPPMFVDAEGSGS